MFQVLINVLLKVALRQTVYGRNEINFWRTLL